MQFNYIIQNWFESKKGLVKESTLSAYYVALRSHIRPYWDNKDTNTCHRNELQLFVNNCIAKGLSVKSAKDMDIINRKITSREYDKVVNYIIDSGFENCYIQELSSAEKTYIPKFDFTGIN